ncbi:MAG: hypothetical protein MUC73_12715 [Cyclobacteriaceae bacterium]|jgi:hypothetical protein|nr:hypothetical protein [Cyclobacteriaceae bacterium]
MAELYVTKYNTKAKSHDLISKKFNQQGIAAFYQPHFKKISAKPVNYNSNRFTDGNYLSLYDNCQRITIYHAVVFTITTIQL